MVNTEKLVVKIVSVLERYPVRRAGFFGSYAREEQIEGSDVDLVVDIDGNHRLLFFDIYDDIEAALDIGVDLIPLETIERCKDKYTIAKNIHNDLRWFYERE